MKGHPTFVAGFNGSLEALAHRVCSLRYDQLAAFFGHCAEELRAQANADHKRGRVQLSAKLTSAWGIANAQQRHIEGIFEFCKPHMKDELAD